MRTTRTKPLFNLSAIACGLAAASLSYAQESTNSGLETIEVTARKTVETLQEVPISITSVGAIKLEEVGASVLTEIQQFSPNTTLQTSRGTNSTLTAFIRGVGQQDPLWGYEPGVVKKVIVTPKQAKLAKKVQEKISGGDMMGEAYVIPKNLLPKVETDAIRTAVANLKRMMGLKHGGLARILEI